MTFLTTLCALLLLSGCVQVPVSPDGDGQSSEQAFNDSGQAKAIEDETDLWMFFEDADAGLSLRYPHNVKMDPDDSEALFTLRVESEPISTLEGTMGYNAETAAVNMAELAQGIYGEDVDFPLEVSKNIRSINGGYAQDFLVLGRFEVCSVVLERKLYFFHQNHQVVITLSAQKEAMLDDVAEYLTLDPENCMEEAIWDFDKQPEFYRALANGTGSLMAQEWFDTFDSIINTLQLNVTTAQSLQGKWVSAEDPRSSISFVGDTKTDYYDDAEMAEGVFVVVDNREDGSEQHIIVKDGEESFEYGIVEVTGKKLELLFLPRGNTLMYTRSDT